MALESSRVAYPIDAVTTACAGSACATLPNAVPLVRGGLATVGDELYWVGKGSVVDALGEANDELQHSALPACATIAHLPLATKDGKPLRVFDLHRAGDGVMFLASPPGGRGVSFYLSNGSSFQEVYSGFDDQNRDYYSVDANGFAVTARDFNNDGWDKSSLTYCAIVGTTVSKPCTVKMGNAPRSIVLTPTRLAKVSSGSVVSLSRASFDGLRYEPVYSKEGSTPLFGIGEFVFGMETSVRSEKGKVYHDTSLFRDSKEAFHGAVPGYETGFTSDGSRGYIVTRGEGDVFERQGTGVVARINPEAKVYFTRTLATGQDGSAVAVSSKHVYWVQRTSAQFVQPATAVIRFTAK